MRVETEDGRGGDYDAVVLATHADVSLRLLADADADERQALGAFRYSKNRAVLHTDRTLLPARLGAWASWNSTLEDCRAWEAPVSLSYHLNRLQGFEAQSQYCVTLNASRRPEGLLAEMEYEHPVLDAAAVLAQKALRRLSGRRATYFAGAHLGYGFHEDGLRSALDVAAQFGIVA